MENDLRNKKSVRKYGDAIQEKKRKKWKYSQIRWIEQIEKGNINNRQVRMKTNKNSVYDDAVNQDVLQPFIFCNYSLKILGIFAYSFDITVFEKYIYKDWGNRHTKSHIYHDLNFNICVSIFIYT